jgi:hypothetical protein
MNVPLVTVSDVQRGSFGKQPMVASHSLQDHPLFTDAALIDLLDNYPRSNLYALNMGSDPLKWQDNRLAIHDGVSGAEMLRAVRNGRLWLNITRVNLTDPRYRLLIDQLYAQLAQQVPGFKPITTQGTLLLSSPGAMVYYHADGPASVLWHIRGRKRIWVYPALDEKFMSRELLEDIFAGVRHEYLPYETSFDDAAVVYDLEPGQFASWPQNAPHRVSNLDSVNVSLSTEHFTQETIWRSRVYTANRFFRTRLGMRGLSTQGATAGAYTQLVVHRIARKLGLDVPESRRHIPMLRIDADAPGGVVPLNP